MTDTDHRPPRILVVEDEYFVAKEIAEVLAQCGAVVVGPVGHIDDALDLAENEEALDAALLDVNIQGDKVFPVADILLSRGVPFIFSSGYDVTSLPEPYVSMKRVEKPIDTKAVVQELLAELKA
jgi:CheY-like chemotaxis protein